MNQFDFVKKHRSSWEELERLISETRRRPEADSLRRLGRLYRRAAADLAFAKANFSDSTVVPYLNQLVAEGHSHIYGRQLMVFKRLLIFYQKTFPDTLKQARNYVIISAVIFFLAASLAFLAVSLDREMAASILPKRMAAEADKNAADITLDQMQTESALITVNNIQVAFVAFAFGVFFGAGTVYVLILNGILLGALAAVFARYGLSIMFWSLIVPHGALELPAIFVAAAAGLMLGDSLIRPGESGRVEALSASAGRAVILVGGVIPVFVVAGLIEGFFTPLDIPAAVKYAVSAAAGIGGLLFFTNSFRAGSIKKDDLI